MKKLILGILLLASCSAQTNNLSSSSNMGANNLSSSSNMGANDGVIINLYSSLCEDVLVAIFRQNGSAHTEFYGRKNFVDSNPEYCTRTIDLTVRETIIEVILVNPDLTSKFVFDRNHYYFLIDDRR